MGDLWRRTYRVFVDPLLHVLSRSQIGYLDRTEGQTRKGQSIYVMVASEVPSVVKSLVGT